MKESPAVPRPLPARLLIVDDHELARTSLRLLLSGEPDLVIVGEASNGQEAITLCHQLQPDLVLMNLRMPVMDGLTATRLICQAYPATKVLILTIAENPTYLIKAKQAGASGYLFKDSTLQELVSAIRQVLQGQLVFPHQPPL